MSGSNQNYEVDGRAWSSQILLTLSAKLPSYSGVKWCRFAHEEPAKRQTPIGFKDFLLFVKQEAEAANDPAFLLTLSRENETKLPTQMSSAFVLQDENDEVKRAQASLSFRLWQNWEKLAELRLHYLR